MCVLKIIILDTSLIEIKTWVHKRPVSECLQQLNLQWQKAWSNPDILQWVNRQSVVHPVVEPTLQPTGTNYTTTQMDSWRIMLGEEATPRGYGLCDFTLLTFLTWETDGCLSGIRDIGTREGGSCTAWMYKVYSRGGGLAQRGVFCPDYTHGHTQVVRLNCLSVRCQDRGKGVMVSRINSTEGLCASVLETAVSLHWS